MMKKVLLFITMFFAVGVLPCAALADDTDMYDITNDVKPNVLIIFDNSGSMDETVPYNDATTYALIDPGSDKYLTNTIYQKQCTHEWWDRRKRQWVCDQWDWVVYGGSFVDNNSDGIHDTDSDIRKGNRLNYDFGGAQDRISLARQAVKNVINLTYDYARFGIMVLNAKQDINGGATFPNYHNDTTVLSATYGGAEIADRGEAEIGTLMDQLDSLDADGGTPLANRLINAAKYFRGTGGFKDKNNHLLPRPLDETHWCRQNFVIIMTDGKPEGEGNNLYANNNGDYDDIEDNFLDTNAGCRDCDSDGKDPDPTNRYVNGGSDYLDDLAYYLHHTEDSLDPNGDITDNQNLTIYTIGFTIADQLLEDTATNGGGKYYTANDADELAEALLGTMISIIAQTQTFTAPVVPVHRTTSGDVMYVSLFTPTSQGNFWPGYLIKLGIGNQGRLMGFSDDYGADGGMTETVVADDESGELDGNLINPDEAPYPYWDAHNTLRNRTTPRNIYTYLGTSTDLTDSSNAFNTSNISDALLASPQKHPNAQAGTEAYVDLINYLIGWDSYDDDGGGVYDEKRKTILGDILHSQPLVIDYVIDDEHPANNERVIYVGTNDGMLHAFDDSDGSELWAFIPPDLLPQLKNIAEGDGHQYFVDGSPRAYILDNDGDEIIESGDGDRVIIIFGERRGGYSYTALDATDPDAPQYLWSINNTTAGFEELGQSWSDPVIGKVKTGVEGSETDTIVAIIGGGYSPDNSAGRGLYVINVLTGALVESYTFADSGTYPVLSNMTYSIPSAPLAVDTTFDNYINRVYVGDLGGQMWRFGFQRVNDEDDGVENANADNWSPRLLFATNTDSPIFYPPDLVLEPGYAYLYFGTGDRTNPCAATGTNRFFAVKDRNETNADFTTLDENDLVNLTNNDIQDHPGTQAAIDQASGLITEDGWYINMEGTGEKILASPVVIYGIVFFTSFVPSTDPCSYGGDAYLYAVDYLNATAVLDFNEDGSLDKSDRSFDIGSGIPTEAVVTINAEGETIVYVGVGGGIFRLTPDYGGGGLIIKSWREVF
jgi:type IV pilus assembly protein PilY1